MKPESFYVHIPTTQDLDYSRMREVRAVLQGIDIKTWYSINSPEIYQRVDADTEAALSFYLLSLPEE